MKNSKFLNPRDRVKLAFQYKETEYLPYVLELTPIQEKEFTKYYGDSQWKDRLISNISSITGVDYFLSLKFGVDDLLSLDKMSIQKDGFGCTWKLGGAFHLVDWPLHEAKIGNYKLPDLDDYFKLLRQKWPSDIKKMTFSSLLSPL